MAQHPCFVGSGVDSDDTCFAMIIAHFLQRKQKYVSYGLGGFKGVCFYAQVPIINHICSAARAAGGARQLTAA